MRIPIDPKLPSSGLNLVQRLNDYLRMLATQVNNLSDARIDAYLLGGTSAPTSGTWKQGDFVPNTNPTELGTVGSKYTIAGWRCVSGGSPGTWVQARDLTGN